MLYTFPCAQLLEEWRELIWDTENEVLGRGVSSKAGPQCIGMGLQPPMLWGNQLPLEARHECQPASLAVPAEFQACACPPRCQQHPALTSAKELGQPTVPPHTGTTTSSGARPPSHPHSWEQWNRTHWQPHPMSLVHGSGTYIRLAGQHTSGMGGNQGVLAPKPCSITQRCQGTSVGTTAGLISKSPC